jgi:hypothetical protein
VVLRGGWSDAGVRVVHAVEPAFARMVSVQAIARRHDLVGRAFDSGKLGTDVLEKPLFPYQQDGVVHLARAGRALLADDMGLGKTVQAIAACEILRRRGEAQRVVVVTPASLKDQWAKEIRTCASEEAVVVGGSPQRRRQAFASDAPYKILNYELTWRELSQLQALDADVLVLDEALASVVGGLVQGPAPASHDALVAAIFRDLLPSGRLPHAAHGALARLRDLTVLEQHGVEVEAEIARAAVEEARQWVGRLSAGE